ncbi:glutaredoxin family protein [uncultured Corynebacterium sp.]|uniref:glutaredoxin family protein n=1 Tax=uncultured Corynebacterium sp. TaxID=159447 RepID=UPI00345BA998
MNPGSIRANPGKKERTGHAMATVTMMTRATCGSCERVEAQIRPIAQRYGADVEIVDVDAGDGSDALEFGDRVPVILVDGEEIACWEIDDDELIEALEDAG